MVPVCSPVSGFNPSAIGDRAAVVLVGERDRPRRVRIFAVREGDFAAGRDRVVGRREGVPLLTVEAEREMRRDEIWLHEVEPDAAIERGPAHVDARRSGAAEKVHVVILRVHPRFFFGAIADAEIDPLVIAFSDRHPDRDVFGLLVGVLRFHVGELKQLETVEPPLRVLHLAAVEQLSRLERQLALDDVVADAGIAGHLDGAEVSQLARLGREGHRRLTAIGAIVFSG
jgi:hypothetical protein